MMGSLRRWALLLANGGLAVFATQYPLARPRSEAESDIFEQLGPRLSDEATIVLPSWPIADPLVARVSRPRISPGYAVIVEVATEADVQQTIKYANRHGMPFLAVSGTHGTPWSLNRVKNGIQINMRKMNRTTVRGSGETVTIGGGTMQYELTSALYNHGKNTVTGVCECVSVAGPLLGGGHGLLQPRHGLAADNLVSARVVLANGTAVDVSATERPDLFWGLRGAGHNFGIVTELTMKIYPVRTRWTVATLSFTHDKVEALFKTWNKLLDGREEDSNIVVLFGAFARIPELDRKHPVVSLQLLNEGDGTAMEDYMAALRRLKPAAESTLRNLPWPDLYKAMNIGLDSHPCQGNQNLLTSPNSFTRWDAAAMREGFDIFSELTADTAFASSLFLLETYGNKGVRAVPESDSAVAPEERRYDIIISSATFWNGEDAALTDKAIHFSKRMQAATRSKHSPPHSYVNYGVGDEELGQVYGWDEARLARLRRLKKVYDEHNRFGFYMPIHDEKETA